MNAALGSYAEAQWTAKRLFDVYTDQDGISWPSMEGHSIAAVHVVVYRAAKERAKPNVCPTASSPEAREPPSSPPTSARSGPTTPVHSNRHRLIFCNCSRKNRHLCQQHLRITRSTPSCASVPALSSYSTAWIWLGDKRPASLHYCHANLS